MLLCILSGVAFPSALNINSSTLYGSDGSHLGWYRFASPVNSTVRFKEAPETLDSRRQPRSFFFPPALENRYDRQVAVENNCPCPLHYGELELPGTMGAIDSSLLLWRKILLNCKMYPTCQSECKMCVYNRRITAEHTIYDPLQGTHRPQKPGACAHEHTPSLPPYPFFLQFCCYFKYLPLTQESHCLYLTQGKVGPKGLNLSCLDSTLALQLTSCTVVGKEFSFYVPQFPHLWNGSKRSCYLIEFLVQASLTGPGV